MCLSVAEGQGFAVRAVTGWYAQPDELARSAKRGFKNSPPGRSAVASPQFEAGQWASGWGDGSGGERMWLRKWTSSM